MPKVALQIRLEENTHQKLKVIADNELRSLNAQLEYFILQGIKEYETNHGSVDVPHSE